jgi:1-acyl-sn-glycerol-3-phosphate acyltransferase
MGEWKFEPARDHGLSPVERAKSLKREAGLVASTGHVLWWTAVRGMMRVWHRLEVHGAERLPTKPPFVMVANHSSHLDVLAMAAPLSTRLRDKVFPIAAADVFFDSPPVSMFASLMLNALPMYRANRGRHALAELRERLVSEPCGFLLFPEGARSRDGKMLPVKAGLGMIVAGTPVPVVPCWLDGCFDAMRPGQVVPRPKKIKLSVGESVSFESVSNERAGWEVIAQELETRMRALGGQSLASTSTQDDADVPQS